MASPRVSTTALRALTRSAQRPANPTIRSLHTTGRATRSTTLAQSSPSRNDARTFHTTQSLAAARDNSTIDFAFLPMAALHAGPDPADADLILRMPILPIFDSSSTAAAASSATTTTMSAPPSAELASPDGPVMKAEISAMSADAVFLPMTELADGHAMNVDFHAFADRLSEGVRGLGVPVEQQASLVKRIFGDIVDDVFGVRGKVAAPSA